MKLKMPSFRGRKKALEATSGEATQAEAGMPPRGASASSALPIEPALIASATGAPPLAAVAIVALGIRDTDLAGLADAVLDSVAKQRYRPVFVTDVLEPTPLRERSLPFEFLPPQPPLGHDPQAYERLLLARMAIWQRKWRFARLITAGPQARRRVDAWRASGIVEAALAELLNTASPGS